MNRRFCGPLAAAFNWSGRSATHCSNWARVILLLPTENTTASDATFTVGAGVCGPPGIIVPGCTLTGGGVCCGGVGGGVEGGCANASARAARISIVEIFLAFIVTVLMNGLRL